MKFELSEQIFKKYSNSWKSLQWEPSCFMQTDRQVTDRHVEAASPFCKFVNTSKKS